MKRIPDDKALTGLGREELLKLVRSMRDEIKHIDILLCDASWTMASSEVEHQISCHEDTLPEFTRKLAEHLRKIDAVGLERREDEMEALEPK